MKTGDLVKYSKPMNDQEKALRFVLVEDRDTRVLIELVCDWALKPRECVAKSEVELDVTPTLNWNPDGVYTV